VLQLLIDFAHERSCFDCRFLVFRSKRIYKEINYSAALLYLPKLRSIF
jgi:hypothetical protein